MGVGDMQNENSATLDGPAVLPLDNSSSQDDQKSEPHNLLKNLSLKGNNQQTQNGISGYPGQLPSGHTSTVGQPSPFPHMTMSSSMGHPSSGPQTLSNSAIGQPTGHQMPPTSNLGQLSSGPHMPTSTIGQNSSRPQMTLAHSGQIPAKVGVQQIPPTSAFGQMSAGSQMSNLNSAPRHGQLPPGQQMSSSSGYPGQLSTGNQGIQQSGYSGQSSGPQMPPSSGYGGQPQSNPQTSGMTGYPGQSPSGPQMNSMSGFPGQQPTRPQIPPSGGYGMREQQNENSSDGPAVLPLDNSSAQQDQKSEPQNSLKNQSLQGNNQQAQNGISGYSGQLSSGPSSNIGQSSPAPQISPSPTLGQPPTGSQMPPTSEPEQPSSGQQGTQTPGLGQAPPGTQMPQNTALGQTGGPQMPPSPVHVDQQPQGAMPLTSNLGQLSSGPQMPPASAFGQNSSRPHMTPAQPMKMGGPQMPPTSNFGQMSSGPQMANSNSLPRPGQLPPGPQMSSGYPGQLPSGNQGQSGYPGQSAGPQMPPSSVYGGQPPSGPQMSSMTGYPGQPQSGPQMNSVSNYPGQSPSGPQMPPPGGYGGQPPSGPQMTPSSGYPGQPPSGPQMTPSSGYPGQPPSGPQMNASSGYPGQPPSGPQMNSSSGYPGQPPSGPQMNSSSGYPGHPPSGPQATPSSGYPGQLQSGPQLPSSSGYPGQPQQRPGPPSGYPGQAPARPGVQTGSRYPVQPPQRPGMQSNSGYPGQLPSGSGQPPAGPGQLPPVPGQLPPGPGQLPPGPGQLPPGPGQLPPGPGHPSSQGYPGQGGMPNSQPTPGFFPGQNIPPVQPYSGHSNQMQPPSPGMPPSFGYPGHAPQGPGQQYSGQPGPMSGPSVGGQNAQGPSWQAPGGQSYPQPTAQQQPKRLDPDQMPSAIGVMQEDQQTRSGLFSTNAKGLLPPLVTTKFQVDDQGNASPRFIRSTMYSVPAQPDMLKQTAIPFALVINPFESPAKDEQPLQWVDLGPMGPVRCIRCKAYMSPLMQFIDGGRRFQCLLCKATTEVPAEYFQHMDHTGSRIDKWERPELCKGSYEVVATMEYCRGNMLPKEPAFIFVIDVSYNNVKSGLVNLLCSHMKTLLECLPSHTPVGFITYNSKVHFFNIDPSLTQPQMVIVPDVSDMFMPLLTGFLVPRAEAVASIDILMEQIPTLFADTKETESVLGPAIQAGMEALKASERVGKLLLFHSSLPTSDVAPGKLRNREADRKLLGTDKEKAALTPQSTYYNNLGQDCVQHGVSVDLYLFNNSYIDVATIGQVARITGGSVSKYTYFQADIDGPRVVGELTYHLSRPIGFDAVMRVRTSTGVRPTDFHGHFFMANTTDVEIAAIDSNKGIAVEIKHDDKLTDEDGVYVQVALLYTTIYGQRRLRIHNLALNTCNQMADLYRNCELDTITNFLAKQCISKSVDSTPQAIKDGVINRCAQMLATYRKHCANPSMPGQLILPECLKLLPLYINCVLRSDAVSGNHEITPDDRSWLMYTTMTMGVGTSVHYFYPKLVPIAGPDVSSSNEPIRCSYDKLKDDSAFILENGIYIFLWIGAAVSPDWLQDIFGVSNIAQLNVETITELPDHVNSDESLRLRAFIRQLRGERNRHMRLTIVRQKDKMEMVMKRFLIEDRSSDGQPSYVDFLCHMHKEIRALLNQ